MRSLLVVLLSLFYSAASFAHVEIVPHMHGSHVDMDGFTIAMVIFWYTLLAAVAYTAFKKGSPK